MFFVRNTAWPKPAPNFPRETVEPSMNCRQADTSTAQYKIRTLKMGRISRETSVKPRTRPCQLYGLPEIAVKGSWDFSRAGLKMLENTHDIN